MTDRRIKCSGFVVPLCALLLAALAGCNGDSNAASTDGATTNSGAVSGSSGGSTSSSSSSSSSGGSTSSSSSSSSSGANSANSSSSSGGTGNLSAPTHVQIVLQGQDSQEKSNSTSPQQPNHLTIAWKSVNGATSYNIYRSVNQGAYALYTTVSATAASTAYNSYVSKSGNYDYQTSVDSAYQDIAATNAVGYPKAANSAGTYFPNNVGYTYKVSAVSGDGEGALSSDSIAIYFAGGLRITNDQVFNGSLTYADSGATGASPLGYTTNAKWTTSSGNTIVNPYSGYGAVDQNLCIKGFKYLVLNVQAAQSGSSFQLDPELAGDQRILTTALSSTKYGTLVANQWVTLKIPLTDLMVDQVGGTNAQQYSFYKVTLASNSQGNQSFWIEWYFSVN